MGAREAIAAAANTVPGIHVSPYYNQDLTPGVGRVRYDHTEYPNRFGGVVTWQVVINLPSDQADAERAIEQHLSQLVKALSAEMGVTNAGPQQITLPTGGTHVFAVISGTREEE